MTVQEKGTEQLMVQKKWGKWIIVMVMAIMISLCGAFDADAETVTKHDISTGNITCNSGKYEITGETDKYHITIEGDDAEVEISDVKIDLYDEYNDDNSVEADAIRVKEGCHATLVVRGENNWLRGGNYTGVGVNWGYAGINIESGASLTIKGNMGNVLTVYGGGDNEGGAAIGSSAKNDMGDLKIEGNLTIKARGAANAAGIGSGHDTVAGNITINSGDIYAKGGYYAAGIGGGYSDGAGDGGDTKDITINGGTIEAVGGEKAAGIGGSHKGNVGTKKNPHTIKITGGTITATGGDRGAGIGGGEEGYTSAIEVSGGNITAKGGIWAAGIGAGNARAEGVGGDIGSIKITGGTINAAAGGSGNKGGAGIGGSDGGEVSSLRIEEAAENSLSITAQGGAWGAGIGSAANGATTHNIPSIYIKLNGGTITAAGGTQGAGIGGGNTSADKIEIYGKGTINATGVDQSCAIGAGECEDGGDIIIEGDYGVSHYKDIDKDGKRALNITAKTTGLSGAAVIGAADSKGGDITIKNADVILTDSTKSEVPLSAGIGNADAHEMTGESMGSITIENCKIVDTAFAGKKGPSIGAGWNSAVKDITIRMTSFSGGPIGSTSDQDDLIKETSVGMITIEDSKINAVRYKGSGAAIGSGEYCAVKGIAIKGSEVTASTCSGAAIGSGGYDPEGRGDALKATGCECGDITISNSTVTATGRDGGAGIGGGWGTPVGDITITDSKVTASSEEPRRGDGGAGIGGGHGESTGKITILNSEVNATGGPYSAAIGSSGDKDLTTTLWNTTCHSIDIEDNSVITAKGGEGAAAIGTGHGAQFAGGDTFIRIKDSTVEATGGNHGAGIGAGANGSAGSGGEACNIYLRGKSVITANGGFGAAGIGGGYDGGADEIYIDLYETVREGGQWKYYVKATAGQGAAGIGAGGVYQKEDGLNQAGHHVDKVDISGGYVMAQGGSDDNGAGAGIGGGAHDGYINHFSMSGGFVEAKAGYAAPSLTSHQADDIGCGGCSGAVKTAGDAQIDAGTVIGNFSGDFDLTINGGSVSYNSDDVKRKDGTRVYRTLMNLGSTYTEAKNMKTSVSGYGTKDIFSDGNNKVYLYMPLMGDNNSKADCSVGLMRYYYGTTTKDGNSYMKMDGILQFEGPKNPDNLDGEDIHPIVGDEFVYKVREGTLPDGTKVKFTVTDDADNETDKIEIVNDKTVTTTPDARVCLKTNDRITYRIKVEADNDGDNPGLYNEMYWKATGSFVSSVTQEKAEIQITEDPSKVYDGKPVENPAVTVKGDASASSIEYRYYWKLTPSVGEPYYELMTNDVPVNAGEYAVKALLPSTQHYANATSEMVDFTIEKRPVMLELSAEQDGADANIKAAVSGFAESETLSYYGYGTVVFEIEYGEGESKTVKKLEADVKKNESTDPVSYSAEINFENVPEGAYTVTAEWIESEYSSNYKSVPVKQSFNKTRQYREMRIADGNGLEYTYGVDLQNIEEEIKLYDKDGKELEPISGEQYKYEVIYSTGSDNNSSVMFMDSVEEDGHTYSYSGKLLVMNTGIALIKVTLPESDVYSEAVAYARVTVNKRDLTVTPHVYNKYKGSKDTQISSKTYGSLDELGYYLEYEGFAYYDGENDFTKGHGTLEAVPLDVTTDAGTYKLGVNRVPAEGSKLFYSRNYKINVADVEFTVKPAILYITADDKTSKYGVEPEYTYTLGNKEGKYKLMSWDDPDDVVESVGFSKNKPYHDIARGRYIDCIKVNLKDKTNPDNKTVNNYIFEKDGKSTIESGDLEVLPGDINLEVNIKSKTYDGEKVKADIKAVPITSENITPSQLSTFGTDETYYRVLDDGSREKLKSAPKDAGKYVLNVVAGKNNSNYNQAETEVSFRIYKALPDIEAPELPDIQMKKGLTLSDQKLPSGWEWRNPDQKLDVGHVAEYAVYTPDDTTNYLRTAKLLSFNVYDNSVTPGGDGGSGSTDGGNGINGILTGDDSHILIWAAVAVIMLGIIITLVVTGRKRK